MFLYKVSLLSISMLGFTLNSPYAKANQVKHSGINMLFQENVKKVKIGMTKNEVIKILGNQTNEVDNILYFTDPTDLPRVGHTTVVYKFVLDKGVIVKISEVPGIDVTGPAPSRK